MSAARFSAQPAKILQATFAFAPVLLATISFVDMSMAKQSFPVSRWRMRKRCRASSSPFSKPLHWSEPSSMCSNKSYSRFIYFTQNKAYDITLERSKIHTIDLVIRHREKAVGTL